MPRPRRQKAARATAPTTRADRAAGENAAIAPPVSPTRLRYRRPSPDDAKNDNPESLEAHLDRLVELMTADMVDEGAARQLAKRVRRLALTTDHVDFQDLTFDQLYALTLALLERASAF